MILSMKDWGIIMDIMVVINQMIQLFLIIGLGYFMQKKKILNDELNTKLNFIVISITTPALIFHLFVQHRLVKRVWSFIL